jgi:hypothetical protein
MLGLVDKLKKRSAELIDTNPSLPAKDAARFALNEYHYKNE